MRIARATKLSAFGLFIALACAGALQFRHQPVSPHEQLTLRPISVKAAPSRERSALSERLTLRVGTINIHGPKGRDGQRDLDRTARSLQELDIVGLNEVRGDWFAWRPDQADELGRRLNMASLFAPSEQVGWFDRFGNGLLSRLELTSVQRIPLPCTQSKRFRNAVLTGVHWDGQVVRILAVHVDSTRDRERQLELISDLFLSLDEPALLMGDLNSRRDDPTLLRLLTTVSVIDVTAEAEPIDRPPERRIDWILTRGLKVVRAEVRDDGASDHPVVRAELIRSDPVRSHPIHRVSDRNHR